MKIVGLSLPIIAAAHAHSSIDHLNISSPSRLASINLEHGEPGGSKANNENNNSSFSTFYCPTADDMSFGGNVQFSDSGWTIYGSGHVGGRTSYNLLGGYVSFDMETTNTNDGVNTNLYLISPQDGPDMSGYCDIQENGSPQCMEMDMIEVNGNCYMQTTWHTEPNMNGGCDEAGCAASTPVSNKYSIKSTFSNDGFMSTTVNGVEVSDYYPYPDDGAKSTVKSTMSSIGAALWSSQWEGWVPQGDSCPGYSGGLAWSSFTISNLVVKGSVVQGVNPTVCGEDPTVDDDPSDDHTPPADDDGSATCFTEENYDYSGYDISYDDVQGPSQCCGGCAATAGCVAWTFSEDQWGNVRCYYKSSTAGRTYAQGMTSGTLENVDSTCVTEKNYDYLGNDITYDDVQGSSQCCSGCEATLGCVAWTFSEDRWGNVRCYYKTSMDGRTFAWGVTSGYLTSSSNSSYLPTQPDKR